MPVESTNVKPPRSSTIVLTGPVATRASSPLRVLALERSSSPSSRSMQDSVNVPV
jgi:hypothetical protein